MNFVAATTEVEAVKWRDTYAIRTETLRIGPRPRPGYLMDPTKKSKEIR